MINKDRKKIKIKFVGFSDVANMDGEFFNPKDNFIIDILSRHFDVELSENPDYVFYSLYGYAKEHFKYDGIRIYFMMEYVEPDYNVCDYALGLSHQVFGDRHFRYRYYIHFKDKRIIEEAEKKIDFKKGELKKKDKFCGFVHANGLAPERERMAFLISNYKGISSGGRYKNNIGYYVKDKKVFYASCKFAMAFENSYGYDSGRIIECFAARTIPVYWGDPKIIEEINEKAFVNVHQYASFEDAVKEIERIDQDDELYEKIMQEPVYMPDFQLETYEKELEGFLVHIFQQDYEKAFRRNRNYWGYAAEKTAYSGAKCRAIRIFFHRWLSILLGKLHMKKLQNWLKKKIIFYQ